MARRISIIDDDPLVRNSLRRLCKAAGYEVDAYESAEAYLDREDSGETAFLVLDLQLPGLSGLELQAELEAAKALPPTVFVTAQESERSRAEALAHGAIDYLRKPLDTEHLLAVIEAALRIEEG